MEDRVIFVEYFADNKFQNPAFVEGEEEENILEAAV
jgi:hypothetical protein